MATVIPRSILEQTNQPEMRGQVAIYQDGTVQISPNQTTRIAQRASNGNILTQEGNVITSNGTVYAIPRDSGNEGLVQTNSPGVQIDMHDLNVVISHCDSQHQTLAQNSLVTALEEYADGGFLGLFKGDIMVRADGSFEYVSALSALIEAISNLFKCFSSDAGDQSSRELTAGDLTTNSQDILQDTNQEGNEAKAQTTTKNPRSHQLALPRVI